MIWTTPAVVQSNRPFSRTFPLALVTVAVLPVKSHVRHRGLWQGKVPAGVAWISSARDDN